MLCRTLCTLGLLVLFHAGRIAAPLFVSRAIIPGAIIAARFFRAGRARSGFRRFYQTSFVVPNMINQIVGRHYGLIVRRRVAILGAEVGAVIPAIIPPIIALVPLALRAVALRILPALPAALPAALIVILAAILVAVLIVILVV